MTTGENSSTMNGNVRSGGHTVEEKYMNIIKAVNLVFDYIRRDEEGQVEEVKRALDHVNLEIEKGSFVAIRDTMVPASPHLPSRSMAF